MRLICAGLIATLGCSDSPGTGPNVDAGPDTDGGADPKTTLVVELESSPEIPGMFEGSFTPTMQTATVEISDFRAVGDGASSDNQRIDELRLTWESDEIARFEDIPVGRYTRTRGRIDRYRFGGTLIIDATTFDWEIDDTPPGGIDVTSDFPAVELGGGDERTVEIGIELERVFESVDWSSVPPDGELLRIDSTSPEIDGVRGKVREAFEEGETDS